jgi:hypothetical protein
MLRTIAICTVLLFAATVPVRAQPAPAHPATAAHTRATAAQPTATSSLAANQFSSEQSAKGHCPGDAVVWVNLGGSKAYHISGTKFYGKTKHGAFMCQKEADQSGFHAAGGRANRTAAKSTNAKTTK